MATVKQQQQRPAYLNDCLHRLETVDTDSESCSSLESDDSAEKAYWADLLHKAIHHDHEAAELLSSTQSESSSSYWPDHITKATEDQQQHPEVASSQGRETSSLRMVPFVSLNVEWQQDENYDDFGYHNEATDRAQVEPIQIQEATRRIQQQQQAAVYCNNKISSSIPTHVMVVHHNHPQDDDDGPETERMILDPTEPLLYGEFVFGVAPSLTQQAETMYQLLQAHVQNRQCQKIQDHLIQWMEQVPELCQIRYPFPPHNDDDDQEETFCFPMAFFCRTDHLPCLKVAYRCFPEAVGYKVTHLGLPLHYACHYGARLETIDFLLSKFVDATRQLNVQQHTPLHVAILAGGSRVVDETRDVVQTLVEAYPSAAQIPDIHGFTPLHSAAGCSWWYAKELLTLLLPTTCPVMATSNDSQKPLHVAASSSRGCSVDVLQLLVEHEPAQVRYTDDSFQTPLHKAVASYCHSYNNNNNKDALSLSLEPLQYLVDLFPDALEMSDVHDECPWDTAMRILNGRKGPPELWSLLLSSSSSLSSTCDDTDNDEP